MACPEDAPKRLPQAASSVSVKPFVESNHATHNAATPKPINAAPMVKSKSGLRSLAICREVLIVGARRRHPSGGRVGVRCGERQSGSGGLRMLGEERRPEDEGRRTRIDSGDERGRAGAGSHVRACGSCQPGGVRSYWSYTRRSARYAILDSRASPRCRVSGMGYEQARSGEEYIRVRIFVSVEGRCAIYPPEVEV